jgi:hypothetical protein
MVKQWLAAYLCDTMMTLAKLTNSVMALAKPSCHFFCLPSWQ